MTECKKRNPDMRSKPAVIGWFKNNPEAKSHFESTRKYLVSIYNGKNHGFINKAAYPEYRFSSRQDTRVFIRGAINHSTIRIYLPKKLVSSEFRDFCSILGKKKNKYGQYLDFIIATTEDLKVVNDFFRSHKVTHFKRPPKRNWQNFVIKEPAREQTIRLIDKTEVVVSHYHKNLERDFIRWLKKMRYTNVHQEFLLANNDRIDVRFSLLDKAIFAELKTINGSSSKRAIRQALGQILDYKYHGDIQNVDELWIVINGEFSDYDTAFIQVLRDEHSLPLRLLGKNKQSIKAYPPIEMDSFSSNE